MKEGRYYCARCRRKVKLPGEEWRRVSPVDFEDALRHPAFASSCADCLCESIYGTRRGVVIAFLKTQKELVSRLVN